MKYNPAGKQGRHSPAYGEDEDGSRPLPGTPAVSSDALAD